MCHSASCFQPIRQRLLQRTVTLDFNFHSNAQTSVSRSQGHSNLTSFHHCVELRFSHAQRCQALKCGSRSHCVDPICATNPVVFLETGSEKSLPTKTDFLNVFLSSESYCSFGFSRQDTVLHASVERSRILAVHSSSGPKGFTDIVIDTNVFTALRGGMPKTTK